MTEQPLVSVIINCYNSEKYLRETIDSLVAQTYTNWEAVFWDNCSTDKTAEMINGYGDLRFRYFLAEKKTPLGEARNLAIEKVQGDFLCFLDSDDVWEPIFIEKCIEAILLNREVGLVYSRYLNFDSVKEWGSRGQNNDGLVSLCHLIKNYNIGMSGALVDRNVVTKNKISFNNSFSLIEDFDFFITLASLTKVYYLSKPLMRYRHHQSNLTTEGDWVHEHSLFIENAKNKEYLHDYISLFEKNLDRFKVKELIHKGQRIDALHYIFRKGFGNVHLFRYIPALLMNEKFFYYLGSLNKKK